MRIEETRAALDHLVRQGISRYIGASSGYAWRVAMALSTPEREGWARFISMQNRHNLVQWDAEREMIPLCLAEGIGIVPCSSLARGRHARPSPADPEPKMAPVELTLTTGVAPATRSALPAACPSRPLRRMMTEL